jgi:hypothetical protein
VDFWGFGEGGFFFSPPPPPPPPPISQKNNTTVLTTSCATSPLCRLLTFYLRFSYVFTHLVAVYWLNFLLNDPLNLGGNTLDVIEKYPTLKLLSFSFSFFLFFPFILPTDILPPGKCSSFIRENVEFDVLLFSLWIITHSGLARKKYKVLQLSSLLPPLSSPLSPPPSLLHPPPPSPPNHLYTTRNWSG